MINQIIHGDCLEVMAGMESSSVDLVLTDPPYRIVSGGQGLRGMLSTKNVMDGKLFEHNDIEFSEWIPSVYKVLKDKGHFYCFTNHHNLHDITSAAQDVGFKLNNILVMVKDSIVVNCWYMKNVEYVLFFRKGDMKSLNNNSENTATLVRMPKDQEKIHPTQKPVPYLEMLIKNSTNLNETVYDPFAGSGSTAIACLNTNRNFITSEIDKEFYWKTKSRIDDHINLLNGQLLAF